MNGELLQVLGDALLRANHRNWQYERAMVQLQAAAAAKDEFLAVLSHELRTPLSVILNWTALLKKTATPDQVNQAVEVIERNAQLQSQMVEDLLDVTRVKTGTLRLDLKIAELSVLIRASMEASTQAMKKNSIRLDFVEAGEPLRVEVDPGRVQQVFRNIFSNAAKFTPAGGSITVTLMRDANFAEVVVADTGSGIEPEFLPVIFDIFRQQEEGMRPEHGGLGIGLSLVKRLVELHQGTVSIASAGVGQGAQVTVRLPLTGNAATPP